MIPFENSVGWTYGTLIAWWIMAIFFVTVSNFMGVVLNKGWKPYVLTSIFSFMLYWLLTWIMWGEPIWHIAEKLNQKIL